MSSYPANSGAAPVTPTGCSFTEILSGAWRLLVTNPALLAPPFFASAIYFAIYAFLAGSFSAELAQNLSALKIPPGDAAARAIHAATALLSIKMSIMAAAALFMRSLAGIVHHAGWANMFGAAAFRGTASIEDYVDGIICNTGRAFGSAAARFCVHSLPALLALATAIALMRFSSPKTATFLTGVNVLLYSAPAVLAAEMLIYFLFFMWRHAAIIDGMRPVDALSFSSAFVRFRAGEVFSLLMLWLFYNLFIIIAPAAVYMAASGGGIFKSGAQAALGSLPLLLACAACGWIFFIFGSVYFHMASFALYENRSRVALAASAAE